MTPSWLPLRALSGRRGAALALALTATTALTVAAAVHPLAPPELPAITAPAALPDAHADHADHSAESDAKRGGAWRAIASALGALGSAAGGVFMFFRRAAGAAGHTVVEPALKAAAATARFALGGALGGASVVGQVGLWAGRAVIGGVLGLVGLGTALSGLAHGGDGIVLAAGVILGAGATGAAVWFARRLLFRKRRA
jgi:hypothetical protein